MRVMIRSEVAAVRDRGRAVRDSRRIFYKIVLWFYDSAVIFKVRVSVEMFIHNLLDFEMEYSLNIIEEDQLYKKGL